MKPRGAGATLATVLAVLMLAAAACGEGRASFETRQLQEIEAALAAEGLSICEATDTDGHANQAVAGRQLRVAVDCATGDDATLVIDEYDSAADRDAAARNIESQVRPRAGGVVWTFGPYTILVSGPENDDEAVDRVSDALAAIGAK